MKQFSSPKAGKGKEKAWQTIYMDLMTMVMVFFVILWSINQGKDIGVSETVGDVTARMINLPGDVLFPPGKVVLKPEGKEVLRKLFEDPTGEVLNFNTSGLVQRTLMIHGHTDSDGGKDSNFGLGYQRAWNSYKEILKYSKDLPNHVVICTHADNTPEQVVPKFSGGLSKVQTQAVREAKAKNRRITIEDKLTNAFEAE